MALDLALVGCGKMGSALLRGVIGKADQVYVLEPHDLPSEFSGNDKIRHFKTAADFNKADKKLHALIFAIKPQDMSEVCKEIAPALNDKVVLISIAAGKTIASFEKYFGTDQPIVRVMPNTPAAIGKGISVAVKNKSASAAHKDLAETIIKPTGMLEWIDDESLMDAVTALSGSGPAYVFLLIEMMAAAGEKRGLPAALAMKLARQTVIGAAALAESEKETPAATLRENVTSPGGTTEAALNILMNEEVQALFDAAIAAATRRGKELSA